MYKNRDLLLFELWKTCKNYCTFCVDKFMKESSESVKANFQIFKERARNIKNVSAVGFLGGELFDGSIEVLNIKQDFIEFLDILIEKGVPENRILITTSYDNKGRFNRPDSEKWWKDNVEELKQLYSKIQYHCEFILTDNLCTAVLNKEFDLIRFLKWWNG